MIAVLISATLLTAVLRSAGRAVTFAALHCAAVIAHLSVSVFFECAAVLLSSITRPTVPLTSAVPAVALLTSAVLLPTVLRSAIRALSVRTSFRLAVRSTEVSAIFTVDIRTVTHSHGPALASDGHGVVLILFQICGAKEQGIKRLRRSGILIYHIALRIRNRHLSPSPLRRIEGNNQTLLRRTAVV